MKLPHEDQKYVLALVYNDKTLIEELYQKQLNIIALIEKECKNCNERSRDIFKKLLIEVYYWAKDELETQKVLLENSFDQFLISFFTRIKQQLLVLSKPLDAKAQELSKTLDQAGTLYFNKTNAKAQELSKTLDKVGIVYFNKTNASPPKEKHKDHRYIEALLYNNGFLIKEIYEKNTPSIIFMIKKMGGTSDDAKDVFQDALMRLLKQTQTGFILTCPLNAFLKTVCRNLWLNKQRKMRKLDYGGELSENTRSAVNDFWEREEERILYEEALKLLTEKEQELWGLCLTINDLTGKLNTNREIAKILNLSPNYVPKRKYEIKTKLTKIIENLRNNK